MSDKQPINLTRRRVIGGLGAIGVASAGAALGTSAYFSDEESFTDNMMTAGSLDLAVDYVVHEDQGIAGSYTINSFTGEINGEASDNAVTLNGEETAMSLNITDVKPGDHGHAYFCFTIDDNPAYLWVQGELTDSSENGFTEPEPVDENDEGELEESIELDVGYCDIDHETGEKQGDVGSIYEATLAEGLAFLEDGHPLDGTGTPNPEPGSQAPYDGTENESGVEGVINPCVCIEWEIPTDVGNEIQTDSLTFDLEFYAEQARHNENPTNPYAN